MPLVKDEVFALATMRELIEEDIKDLMLLQEQISHNPEDESEVEDYSNISTAIFYLNFAGDTLGQMVNKYDRIQTVEEALTTIEQLAAELPTPTKVPSKSLVPVNLKIPFKKEKTVNKPLIEMNPKEIGEGTVLFDPQGDGWTVKLWNGGNMSMDLIRGAVKMCNVRPENLHGWTFDPVDFDQLVAQKIEEYNENEIGREGFRGWIAAEIVKSKKEASHPLKTITSVNTVLDKEDLT